MLALLDSLVERRIAEAIEAGAFDDLPGAGRPLDLADDRLVPVELRMAHRILKNAGFLPAEVEKRREAASLRQLLAAATDDKALERRLRVKLALLDATLEARGGAPGRGSGYYGRIVGKIAGGYK